MIRAERRLSISSLIICLPKLLTVPKIEAREGQRGGTNVLPGRRDTGRIVKVRSRKGFIFT